MSPTVLQVQSPVCGSQASRRGSLFISFVIWLMTRMGLALCRVPVISFKRLTIVYKLHKKFKNIQHKRNLCFADVRARVYAERHAQTPPPTHQSVHSAGTNSNRLQRDCRPELWALGRAVIEKQ